MQVEKHSYSAVQKWRRKGVNNYRAAHTRRLHIVLQEAYSGHSFYTHGLPWMAVTSDLQHEQTHTSEINIHKFPSSSN